MAKHSIAIGRSNKKVGAYSTIEWESSKKDDFMGVQSYLYQQQTQRCIEYGRTELNVAAKLANYKDKTNNLKDSYIFAVYFNGIEVHREHYQNKKASTTQKVTGFEDRQSGYEEADDFVDSYIGRTSKGWEIIWVSAMYYSAYLQLGTQRHKSYVVLSAILADVSVGFGAGNVKANVSYHRYSPTIK